MALDDRTTELIAIGASVTANCQPCLQYHVGRAREQAIDTQDIDGAVMVGKMVRRGAAAGLDHLALTLRGGTVPRSAASEGGCECAGSPAAAAHPAAASRAVRRRVATLFVDIAGSTSLLVHHPPEVVLSVIQCFMKLVADVAIEHAGNVKDYEGDGALLYFDSPADAMRAALGIRAGLEQGHCDVQCGAGPGVLARMSLTVGDVVVGTVGPPSRQGLALVGPSVNVGSRLLKHITPGEIITTADVLDAVRPGAPEVAAIFRLRDRTFAVPGADGLSLSTYVLAPGGGSDDGPTGVVTDGDLAAST